MRMLISCLAGVLALAGCHIPMSQLLPPPMSAAEEGAAPDPEQAAAGAVATQPGAPPTVRALGVGGAPGNARGPGGFVPRGSAKNFYAAGGGRLWYYVNNYIWAPSTAPREDLWIKAEVTERFSGLRRWPDGAAVRGPAPKSTVEYWEISPKGRSVRLDNHKDFCLLSDSYTAGAITVELTLTCGRLEVRDKKGGWGRSKDAYVLQSRNYSGGGGIGADRARFKALPTEAVTVWRYSIPWDTHPQRLTRSAWKRLKLPTWTLVERRAPPRAALPVPVTTPRAETPSPPR